MKVPLEVSFRRVEQSPALMRKIGSRAARLERFCPGLIACRIAIERPQTHQRRGSPYRVRIEVTVPPSKRLIVRREPSQGDLHTPLQKVIGEAFEAMERRLRDTADLRRGAVKQHYQPRATVEEGEGDGGQAPRTVDLVPKPGRRASSSRRAQRRRG